MYKRTSSGLTELHWVPKKIFFRVFGGVEPKYELNHFACVPLEFFGKRHSVETAAIVVWESQRWKCCYYCQESMAELRVADLVHIFPYDK